MILSFIGFPSYADNIFMRLWISLGMSKRTFTILFHMQKNKIRKIIKIML